MVAGVESPSDTGPQRGGRPISLSEPSTNRKCGSDTVAVCSCCGLLEEVTWRCVRASDHRQFVSRLAALSVPEDWFLLISDCLQSHVQLRPDNIVMDSGVLPWRSLWSKREPLYINIQNLMRKCVGMLCKCVLLICSSDRGQILSLTFALYYVYCNTVIVIICASFWGVKMFWRVCWEVVESIEVKLKLWGFSVKLILQTAAWKQNELWQYSVRCHMLCVKRVCKIDSCFISLVLSS